jgi:hypothetical protein
MTAAQAIILMLAMYPPEKDEDLMTGEEAKRFMDSVWSKNDI